MLFVTLERAFFWIAVAIGGVIGLGVGWSIGWSRGNRRRCAGGESPEPGKVLSALERVNELAGLVAADVRSHKWSMAELTEELAFLNSQEARSVAEVVKRLVEANHVMEQRLLTAEATLEEQTRELETKSAEACTDTLTRLANRRAFNDELTRRYAEFERLQRPLSVMLLDVDHFKIFNDTYGHQVGDEVLRGLAATLRETARGMDLVARYGGEEFGIVLPNTPLVVATAVAERFLDAVAARGFRYEGKVYRITASIGVAELRPGEQVAILLRRVDEALYMSKMRGRNCVHFHDGRQIAGSLGSHDARGPAIHVSQTSHLTSHPPAATQPEDSVEITHTSDHPSVLTAAFAGDVHEEIVDRAALACLVRSRLAEWKRGGKPLAVIMVNLHDHREVTERFGKETGERMLTTVARQLLSAVREMDTVARYNCQCFAVVLPRTSQAQATLVAERILRYLTDCATSSGDTQLPLRVHIGLTEVMEGDDDVRFLERTHATVLAAHRANSKVPYIHTGNWPEPLVSNPLGAAPPLCIPPHQEANRDDNCHAMDTTGLQYAQTT